MAKGRLFVDVVLSGFLSLIDMHDACDLAGDSGR
jgi:hypothetical protein